MDIQKKSLIKQRWLFNGVLLAIAGLLGILVSLKESETSTESPPLTDLSPKQIQQIQIAPIDETPIVLTKGSQGNWYITQPLDNLPAKTFRVQQILQLSTFRDYQPITALSLNDMALDVPLVKVHLDSLIFSFGATPVFDNSRRYLQIEKKFYLMRDTIYPFLGGEPITFVNTAPLGDEPKIITLQLPAYHFQLVKNGAWVVTTTLENIDKRPDTVNRLIAHWQDLQAIAIQNYVEHEQAEAIHITLTGQTQPIVFYASTQPPDFILARPTKGIQYQFPMNRANELLHLPTKTTTE